MGWILLAALLGPANAEAPADPGEASGAAPMALERQVVVSLARFDLGRDTGLTWDPGPGFDLRLADRWSVGAAAMIRAPGWVGVDLDATGRFYPWSFDRWGWLEASLGYSGIFERYDSGSSFRGGFASGVRLPLTLDPARRVAPVLELGANLHLVGSGDDGVLSRWASIGVGLQAALGLAI
jgi:hypothetical protein